MASLTNGLDFGWMQAYKKTDTHKPGAQAAGFFIARKGSYGAEDARPDDCRAGTRDRGYPAEAGRSVLFLERMEGFPG
jgi:hypothetical protein